MNKHTEQVKALIDADPEKALAVLRRWMHDPLLCERCGQTPIFCLCDPSGDDGWLTFFIGAMAGAVTGIAIMMIATW